MHIFKSDLKRVPQSIVVFETTCTMYNSAGFTTIFDKCTAANKQDCNHFLLLNHVTDCGWLGLLPAALSLKCLIFKSTFAETENVV